MNDFTERRCVRCLLQEDASNHITLDEHMVCSLCRREMTERPKDWPRLKQIFEETIAANRGKGPYDGLIMMSGGKDSAYLAYTLKRKYDLNVKGIINDIHYEYQETFENAAKICRALDMPLELNDLNAERMKDFYRFLFLSKNLRDKGCGHICNYCGRLMIRAAADRAAAEGIPMLFSGHNPEQVAGMGQSCEWTVKGRIRQQMLNEMLREMVSRAREELIAANRSDLLDLFQFDLFPEGVTGLFMYQHFPYEPVEMMSVITRELGWQPIKKLSGTYIASGCRLASLWMRVACLNQTSNYVDLELAAQLRSGVLSKDVVERFYNQQFDMTEEVNRLLAELDIPDIGALL